MDNIRNEIDLTDSEMASLFEKRMRLCEKIAEYKKENGLEIYDEVREKELFEKRPSAVSEDLRPLYTDFLKSTVSLSKKHQQKFFDTDNMMTVFTESGSYPVYFGKIADTIDRIKLDRKCLIVTDTNIPPEYYETIAAKCLNPVTVRIEEGEKSKSSDTLLHLLSVMTENGFDRHDCVIASGGGVVGDTAALCASLYMRGIDFYNIPTSLLAMVDSSVGGKTAIDFCGVKNIIGTFYQPKTVLIDTDYLETLPEREYNNAMAEVIKTAALFDKELFSFIENSDKALVRENIDMAVRRCVLLKKEIVELDEKENGVRRCLNFGHTLGHAIESCDSSLLHGECISQGMLFCSKAEARERLSRVLEKYALIRETRADKKAICEKIKHDKKTRGDKLTLVTVEKIGKYELIDVSTDKLIEEIMK